MSFGTTLSTAANGFSQRSAPPGRPGGSHGRRAEEPDQYRYDFSKLIWQIASPKWDFDDAVFDPRAASCDNPDRVAIVIRNYRGRLRLAKGEANCRRQSRGTLPEAVVNIAESRAALVRHRASARGQGLVFARNPP
jgi:hypothetical protein